MTYRQDPLSAGKSPILEYPEDLRRSARVYLGLRFVGVEDYELIAKAVGWAERGKRRRGRKWDVLRAVLLGAQVDLSRNRMVRSAALVGLPVQATAILENGVQYVCPICGYKRNRVPCFSCAPVWPARRTMPEVGPEPPMPDLPTEADPGSPAKLWVLKARLALGQCLFHPDDKWLSRQYDEELPDTVSVHAPQSDWDDEE